MRGEGGGQGGTFLHFPAEWRPLASLQAVHEFMRQRLPDLLEASISLFQMGRITCG